jgi:nucleotide-binding universal stress UspA family protein
MFKTILHANDGSEGAFKALSYALNLARSSRIELHVVCVEEISEFPETIGEVREETRSAEKRYRNVLKRAHEAAAKHQVKLRTHIVAGHPVLAIVNLAAELGADLLVIGATGHYAPHERMIGSRADRLVHLSPCPVLVVK